MTETWCPSEGDKVICVDNSYRYTDSKNPGCFPKVGEHGIVSHFTTGEDGIKVIVITFARKGEKPMKEYFALARGLYLYYKPVI